MKTSQLSLQATLTCDCQESVSVRLVTQPASTKYVSLGEGLQFEAPRGWKLINGRLLCPSCVTAHRGQARENFERS